MYSILNNSKTKRKILKVKYQQLNCTYTCIREVEKVIMDSIAKGKYNHQKKRRIATKCYI